MTAVADNQNKKVAYYSAEIKKMHDWLSFYSEPLALWASLRRKWIFLMRQVARDKGGHAHG